MVESSIEQAGALDQRCELPVLIAGCLSDFAVQRGRYVRPARFGPRRYLMRPANCQFGRRYLQILRRVRVQCNADAFRSVYNCCAAGIVENQRVPVDGTVMVASFCPVGPE